MAGLTKISDGYALECGEIEFNKFNRIESRVFEDISVFKPFLPPMLGDGKAIELLKLYLCVREKGGYECVTRDGSWDLVAKEIGCDLDACASLKVFYVKYLGLLEEYFSKIVKDKSSGGESIGLSSFDSSKFFSVAEMKNYQEFVDTVGLKDLQSCVGSIDGLDAKDDDAVVESNVGITEEETELSRKRKRERYLPLLDWVKRVAKDPCDLAIGSLPERSKWKGYGSEYVWKQVLSAREARLDKTSFDAKAKRAWQKNLRMHPTMYDDPAGKSTSRCSQRLITAKETQASNISSRKPPSPQDWSESSSSGSRSDRHEEHSFYGYNFKRKRTPLGRQFQAQVPESVELTYEPDTKWLGTPIWPLAKTEKRSSNLEVERIGKGRQDCGCASRGSIECARFHVSEKRDRIKLELGSAFLKWEFDNVGESVALKWTPKEEEKFEDIIKANPVSSGITFWSDLWSHFKDKSTAVLVSYYFNVYLYRRRAHQNRSDPSNIDSDDDELENIGNDASSKASPGSIFCSPKKAHVNAR